MEWFGIVALLLLLCYSAYPGKVKRLETKVKRLEKKQRGVAYMSKLINDLVGKQCIIRSEFIFSFAGKTELSCKIIDADDEWIKICYTEKKDKQVAKLMRIENIESIEEQIFKACGENDRAEYGKKLLEQALIDHLQHFLLELGRGFSFVARQKRFTLDGQDFFIDLVFYNYILKCFVLIDLKMGKLTHQDLGQMQMYVN